MPCEEMVPFWRGRGGVGANVSCVNIYMLNDAHV